MHLPACFLSRFLAGSGAGLVLLVAAVAQPQGDNAPGSDLTPADRAWLDLRAAAVAPPPASDLPPGEAGRRLARAQHAARFVQNADRARDFHRQNPGHKSAGEARKLEALLLVQAVHSGEYAVEGRMEDAVLSFTTDPAMPEPERAHVAGAYGFTSILRKGFKPDEMARAHENVARSLILSFPKQPQGYESLLTLAAEADANRGPALARELLRMNPPEPVRQNAQRLVERFELVGRPLAALLDDAGAADAKQSLREGQPTLIYTWATWSPGSVALGEMLAKRNLSAVNVIALNLDMDPTAAETLAASRGLAGVRHFDARGPEGALAQRLKVGGAPQVYLVDAAGAVIDVKGADDLERKLAQLGL